MHELRDIGQCVCSCLMPSSFVMNGLVLFLGSEVRIQDIQLVLLHYSYKLHLQSLHVYVYKYHELIEPTTRAYTVSVHFLMAWLLLATWRGKKKPIAPGQSNNSSLIDTICCISK